MLEHYGRWIAALVVLTLLLAVVILFSAAELDVEGTTLTDVHSAPVFSSDGPREDEEGSLPGKSETPVWNASSTPGN